MCTSIMEKTPVSGSAKGPDGWFTLGQACIGYDHPVHARLEHAISLDFMDESASGRVAVEFSRPSARRLVDATLRTLDEADAYEGLPPAGGAPLSTRS